MYKMSKQFINIDQQGNASDRLIPHFPFKFSLYVLNSWMCENKIHEKKKRKSFKVPTMPLHKHQLYLVFNTVYYSQYLLIFIIFLFFIFSIKDIDFQ